MNLCSATRFQPTSEVIRMPQTIMDVLRLGRCSHEFTWPRRAADGDYYQVCTLCAAEYKYDWTTMRRTERVEHSKPETGIKRSHPRAKRPNWRPRARRLRMEQSFRYRIANTSRWFEGQIENLSQTGLLFHGPQELPVNALIEMVFEMPEEISGQTNRDVVCQGRVMRAANKKEASVKPSKDSEENAPVAMAASIIDYKFIR
jgi:hypothetical protein